ncbi:hypothetical protein [Hubei virga-like virus 12]|uniref:hypothetical protein n=1 Tax=Hubei virga-like virus 12 TaxID=1923327 RepID=UPI00090A36F9|nr:hypothetical protein [Hubei virga-like virus 12]APG77684.1 hypothetical protein [Hubei virga-like virus 12]
MFLNLFRINLIIILIKISLSQNDLSIQHPLHPAQLIYSRQFADITTEKINNEKISSDTSLARNKRYVASFNPPTRFTNLNCLSSAIGKQRLTLAGESIFDGNYYIANDHYDKECSFILKSSSIFEKSNCYKLNKYNCRMIHSIDLKHNLLTTDIRFCWGIKRDRVITTNKFKLRIWKLKNIIKNNIDRTSYYSIYTNNTYWVTRSDNNFNSYITVPTFNIHSNFTIDYKILTDKVYVLNTSPYYNFEFFQKSHDPSNFSAWGIYSNGIFPFRVSYVHSSKFTCNDNLLNLTCTRLYNQFGQSFCKEIYLYPNCPDDFYFQPYDIYQVGDVFNINHQQSHWLHDVEDWFINIFETLCKKLMQILFEIFNDLLKIFWNILEKIFEKFNSDTLLITYHNLDRKYKFTEIIFFILLALVFFKNLTILLVITPIIFVLLGLKRADTDLSPLYFLSAIIRFYIDENFLEHCSNSTCGFYFDIIYNND